MRVAGEREALGRDAHPRPPKRYMLDDGLGRSAKDTGIDQFARRQARRIGPAFGDHHTADDWNNVRRRRAGVDEHRVGMLAADRVRRRRPIRGGDGKRLAARVLRHKEPGVDRIHADHSRRKRGRDGIEHEADAIPFGAKHLRQFGRHRDRVHCRIVGPDFQRESLQHRRERGRVELQLVRTPADRQDFPARHVRHFRIDAADVPAGHVAHRISTMMVCSPVQLLPGSPLGLALDTLVTSRSTRRCK